MSSYGVDDPFDPLWRLLEVVDEALIDLWSSMLKQQGCYAMEDLAFFSAKEMKNNSKIKPIVLRKFKTICQFYAQGHKLEDWMEMKDVLKILSGQTVTNPNERVVQQPIQPIQQQQQQQQQPPPPSQYIPTPDPQQSYYQHHHHHHQPQPNPPPPPPKQQQQQQQTRTPQSTSRRSSKNNPTPTPSRKVVNIIIHADFASSESTGQVHLRQFQSIRNTRIVGLVTSVASPEEQLPEKFIKHCQLANLPLYTDLQDIKRPPPQPCLVLLAANRIHETFWLIDSTLIKPSAILLDVNPNVSPDSLQAIAACGRERQIPLYLHLPRTVAKYIQNTLEMSTRMSSHDPSSFLPPNVMWRVNGEHSHWFTEFVICVMYFGIKVESIQRFQMDPNQTEQLQWSTSYARAAFQMTTWTDVKCSIFWNTMTRKPSYLGVVLQDQSGQQGQPMTHPEPQSMNHSKKTGQPEVDEGRGVAQYDFLQTEDECAVNLKQRVVHLLYHQADASNNKTNALANTKGVIVPTIKIGIEAARLQAYAQEHLDKAMKKLKKNKTPPAHSSNIGGGQQQQQQRRSGLLSMFSSSGSWS